VRVPGFVTGLVLDYPSSGVGRAGTVRGTADESHSTVREFPTAGGRRETAPLEWRGAP